jgi:SAM-dependent methyltransferase
MARLEHRHPMVVRAIRRVLHSHPAICSLGKGVVWRLRRLLLSPVKVEGIPGRVHPNDFMTNVLSRARLETYAYYSGRHFERLGEELAWVGKSWADIGSAIDFGCGYGRLTRWLPAVIAPHNVTACDIQEEAVRWCEREFGVRGLMAHPDIEPSAFGSYDLLLACSVLTHLSPRRIDAFLRTLPRIINAGGIVVFSGKDHQAARTSHQTHEYLAAATVRRALDRDGCYFHAYPHYRDKDIGDTYFTPEWLAPRIAVQAPDFRVVRHEAAGFLFSRDHRAPSQRQISHRSYLLQRSP